jgi:glycosyltransferase involved in cell wall biosynthesis
MKRLLISSGIFPPEIGGPGTYVEAFGHWLQKKKYNITVVTVLKKGLKKKYPFKIEVINKKGQWAWHWRVFQRLFRLLKHEEIIYINGLFFESFFAAFFRKRKYGLRIAGDQVWERAVRKKWSDKNFLDFQYIGGNIRVRCLRKMRKLILNRADKIVAPSFFLAGVIEKWGIKRQKIEVICNPYSPVKPEPFDLPDKKKNSIRIATGGRLVSWKGIDQVIKALGSIKNGFLLIFGDGPERRKLEQLAAQLTLQERICFTGNLSRAQVNFLLSESDCFILNSTYEGLPHIILEAMAAGCPVIATNIGGIPEIIQDTENGFLIEPGNESAMIAAINGIKDDGVLNRQIVEEGRRTVKKNFNIDKLFQKTERIFQELTNGQQKN